MSELCRIWPGVPNSYGYGRFKKENREIMAHRHYWELEYGPVPKDSLLQNICGNRLCIEPSHWQLKRPDLYELLATLNHLDTDNCIEWKKKNGVGRATMNINRRSYNTARVAWTLATSIDPGSLFVLHRCDNVLCINPRHLFLGTAKENALDRDTKGRSRWQRDPRRAMDSRNVRRRADLLDAQHKGYILKTRPDAGLGYELPFEARRQQLLELAYALV